MTREIRGLAVVILAAGCAGQVDGTSNDPRSPTYSGGGGGCRYNCGDMATSSSTDMATSSTDMAASVGGPNGIYQVAMPIPSVRVPSSTDATTDYYTVHVQPGTAQVMAGNPTPIWGFDGIWPGATILAQKGRQVQVTQVNNVTDNITIHNHGHNVAASSDGHPTDYIAPGASKTYTYANAQAASTYWYHDHTMDLTGIHVYKGIEAFYIIHDPAEDALNLPSGSYDIPMVLQDRTFNSDNTLSYTFDIRQGFRGNTMVVNGAVTPYLQVATHKYRFRFLNGSNARQYTLTLSNGGTLNVIGSDGGLLTSPVALSSLTIAPAERYDVVIDFSNVPVGTLIQLNNSDGDWPNLPNVMQFQVLSSVSDTSGLPGTLRSITRYTSGQAVATRTFTFSEQNSEWFINGLAYDPSRIDATPALNTIEKWTLQNQSGEMHPFHQHLLQFQVLDVNGGNPNPEQMGWKDTIPVPKWGSAEIMMQFTNYTGTYVFHCHKLEHEDHRMMMQMNVH
jgi:FtsP/CotA-like multicopper oxidase with cupredoxin domain